MSAHTYVFGRHTISSLLKTHPERVIQLFVMDGLHDMQPIVTQAKQLGIQVQISSRSELDRMTSGGNHQGIVAFCVKQQNLHEADLKKFIENLTSPAFFLVLDTIQDPHNLGACFRTAEAAGVHAIIAPKDKSVGITPTVSKVASGAAEIVPFVQVTNLARTLSLLKEAGIWLYGADAEGQQSLYTTDLQGQIALIMGAEGSGLRRLTRDTCDYLISIPMHGTVASLNISVAAGIFMFEAVRQRLKNGN